MLEPGENKHWGNQHGQACKKNKIKNCPFYSLVKGRGREGWMVGVMLAKVYTRKSRKEEGFVIQLLNQIYVIKLQFF